MLFSTEKIMRGLAASWIYHPEAVAIIINSSGGSLTQSKNISAIIKKYAERKKY